MTDQLRQSRPSTQGAEPVAVARRHEDFDGLPARPTRVAAWSNDPLVQQAAKVLSAGLVAVVVVALVVGHAPMHARAEALTRQTVQVRFEWPPLAGLSSSEPLTPDGEPRTWANAEIRQSLQALALRSLAASPLDADSLPRTREALARTGWFASDLRLSRDPAGVVRVSGTWRVPVAVVRSAGVDKLVGPSGELLPLDYAPDSSGLKVVLGSKNEPPAYGAPWLGGEVQAALQLLDCLRSIEAWRQVAAIDVSAFTPDKQLTIVTDKGNRIIWGGPPDAATFSPGQVKTPVKLARLDKLYRDHGRIDAGQSLVDIRPEGGIFAKDETVRAEPPTAPSSKPAPRGARQQAAAERR